MARGARKPKEELSRLAQLLLELRARAELTQTGLGAKLDRTQSDVSRWESDRGVPDVATARKIATLCKATPDERKELIAMVTTLEPRLEDSRLVMQRGRNLHLHQRIRAIEKDSRLVRAYQPGQVLGQLQVPGYAQAIFTQPRASRPKAADAPAALVGERTDRYRQLAAEPGRQWMLIQTEGSLLWALGSPQVMVEQMDRLTEASLLPHVRLGVIPAYTFSPVIGNHGFHLYDARGVMLGTRNAVALSTDPRDVAEYVDLYGHLQELAVWQDAAREVIERVRTAYASLI